MSPFVINRRRILMGVAALLLWATLLQAADPPKEKTIFDFAKELVPNDPAKPDTAASNLPDLPDAAALAKAEKSLHEVYARQFADETPQGRTALARQFLKQAENTLVEPVERYAALHSARNLAIQAGDLALLNDVLSAIVHAFKVDLAAARLAALQELLAVKTLSAGMTPRAISDAAAKIADEAILRGQLDTAVSAATLADAAAKQSKDAELSRAAAGHLGDVRLLQAEAAKTAPALAKLEKSPDDPDANLVVGRFLCLWRGDWRQGLPLLAKGSDIALKSLAQEELAAASDAPMQLVMGNAWWDFAGKLEGPPKAYAQEHAADAYLQAIPGLEGVYKTMAQKRVAEAPARLPFPRPGSLTDVQTTSADPVAASVHIVADDFVTDIYVNGKPIPNTERKLLAEVYGAQSERVTLTLKPGDWVVFNAVNNRLRWKGVCYFAAAFLNDKDELVFCSDLRSGAWSSCDDLKEIDKFVSDRDHYKDHKPQPIPQPWDRGDASMKAIPGWNGQGIWGAPTSHSTWIKFIVPEKSSQAP